MSTKPGAIQTFRATVGKVDGVATLECRFNGEPNLTVEAIGLTSIPAHFGGRLWFFTCPMTGQRARKLYRWPEIGFAHRDAPPSRPSMPASVRAACNASQAQWLAYAPGLMDGPAKRQ